jgi:hypothetical protein
MELVFNYGFAVFASEAFGVGLFGLFRVHGTDEFLPFGDGVAFAVFCVDEYHDAALAAHHVSEYIFEVGFAFVFVVEVDHFFAQQFALEHILDGELFAAFDAGDELL